MICSELTHIQSLV